MRSPYPWSGLALVGSLLGKAADQWLGDQAWWKALPWGWIAVVSAALIAGALWADIRNPESALRLRWREWRKVFEVRAAYIQEASDPHPHFEIIVLFRVLKDLGACRLTVRVTELRPGGGTRLVHDESFQTVAKDYERRLRLGSIPITFPHAPFARHALWGERLGDKDLLPTDVGLHSGGRFIIEVGLAGQAYRLLLAACPPAMHNEPPPYYLLPENEFPRAVG